MIQQELPGDRVTQVAIADWYGHGTQLHHIAGGGLRLCLGCHPANEVRADIRPEDF